MRLNNLQSSFAVDVVGVFTNDFQQVFKNARPIKAVIKPNSKLMEHPVENGATITDHRIILPTEIELSMILTPDTYRDTYQQIAQFRLNATKLIVQTRVGSFSNQIISDIPHEESADMYNTVAVGLKLKEVQIVTAQFTVVPRNPANNSTINRGNQQPQTPTEQKRSGAVEAYERWLK